MIKDQPAKELPKCPPQKLTDSQTKTIEKCKTMLRKKFPQASHYLAIWQEGKPIAGHLCLYCPCNACRTAMMGMISELQFNSLPMFAQANAAIQQHNEKPDKGYIG